jgi:hypothetical protein
VKEVELTAKINPGLIGFLQNIQAAPRNGRCGPHF